jgi:hypothetical protein
MVALAVVSFALAAAAGLMVEAGRRALVEQARMLEADVPIALRHLEIDVTAAASGSGESERGEPLTLARPAGPEVVYELSGTSLLRKTSDPAGERVALDGVRRFGWQWISGRKPGVVIELEYERIRTFGPDVEDGRRVFVSRDVERRTLELTLRGGGGVGW